MKKIALMVILILAFGLRLYRINEPLADWHSWRQVDTASVSRNFIQNGFDLLQPRFDDISNVPSGLENPEGYRFVEFPIYNFFHAALAKFLPFFSLEVWGRLLSIFASLGSLIFLYLISKKYLGFKTAWLAAFFFAVLPFNIYYSRVVLPEPLMLFTGLGMIYFFDLWIEKSLKLKAKNLKPKLKTKSLLIFILATVFATASWLIKPFTLVLLLPIGYLGWKNWRFNWKKQILLYLGILISLIPFIAWRLWMQRFPEGIPYAPYLFNLTGIRFKGAWFWWLFGERIGKLILGGWGLVLFCLGLVTRPAKKEGLFFFSWLMSILVYFSIVAGGNVRHDYYQILAVPIICIFLAKGFVFLLRPPAEISRPLSILLLLSSTLFALSFSWYQVRDYFNINNRSIVEAGQAADKLLPPDAKVIAPYGGDTAFLYYTNRQGWPVGIEIEKMIKLGATHYVNVNFDEEVEWVVFHYCPLVKTDQYLIVDLTKDCQTK